ncbi:ADP-ribosylation factor-binding protein GGA1-like isoform X2 [Dreissena polymorpha]|uniref:ADP-ribosylation factor-binding protein GGA1-like isoform X2 n=1 Tax=Dreissena polymorpha TaxID=45954 RepID=UPI00226511A6|nr:ADP-ribosylation factor-binding protein GGA1-like isoform X2 [Dreissena polymorpha]
MATKEADLTLEKCLNDATNPTNKTEDWEAITRFTDQVNNELEGPQYAVRLLAHKIQSPIERESLFALTTLEMCIKNCGRRFHNEIGKFRFLNEVIKVISPKYLGGKTTDRVKKRCIELMYCWHKGLPHEPKIAEAYVMLKQQGVVKEDPKYMDEASLHLPRPPPEEERRAPFEDDEKSKLLAKLLKSKNPDDLQAANRLIKNMVKQDAEKMEKVSRRINELETIHTNVKLLSEMVSSYDPQTSSTDDRDMMKELYESLEKLRPKLFRLASETDESDSDALNTILKANDEVSMIMADYKKTVEGITLNGSAESQRGGGNSLVDLAFEAPPAYSQTDILQHPHPAGPDDEMLYLGLRSPSSTQITSSTDNSLLNDLDSIFASASAGPQPQQQQFMYSHPMAGVGHHPPSMASPFAPGVSHFAPRVNLGFSYPLNPTQSTALQVQTGLIANHAPVAMAAGSSGSVFDTKGCMSPTQTGGLADLDTLGKTLLQQNLGDQTPQHSFEVSKPATKVTLNQLATSQPNTKGLVPNPAPPVQPTQPLVDLVIHPPPVSTVTGSTTSTTMGSTNPKSTEVQPLTDVFVPLESIVPGTSSPVSAYDKNGVKVLILVTKNKPREDVTVMVVSVISTNTSSIKAFVFQAAVPKAMKVKLQPPSTTDLPAFNPILPPSAITQVLLLANPQKEKIRLKFKISYTLNEQTHSDVGDIDGFEV